MLNSVSYLQLLSHSCCSVPLPNTTLRLLCAFAFVQNLEALSSAHAPNPGPWQTSQEELVLRRRRILEKHSRSPGKYFVVIKHQRWTKCSFFSSLHKKEEDPIAKVPRKSPEETDSTKAAVKTTMAEAIIKQSCLFSWQLPFNSAQQIDF